LRALVPARLGADFTRLWTASAAASPPTPPLPAIVAPERLAAANARSRPAAALLAADATYQDRYTHG